MAFQILLRRVKEKFLKCTTIQKKPDGSSPICSTDISKPTKPPVSFLDLPPEIHIITFDILQANYDSTTSACLGLTCKTLYPLYMARHAKAPLEMDSCKGVLRGIDHTGMWFFPSACAECANGRIDPELYELLRDWMPRDLVYRVRFCTGKFIPEGTLEILLLNRVAFYPLGGMKCYIEAWN